MKAPDFLLIDLFCGAGGTTTGAELSGVCKVIAAINHDPLAIASHEANHKDVLHLTEDILIADTDLIARHVAKWKARYPQARVILWASLECTNFSNAKGGLPRDADSRALAQGMFRYLDALQPDLFLIENVREFMAWGDLDENGKPVSKLEGREYIRWVKKVQSYGYCHDWRLLCAADFGGVTIRERYFGAFYRPGQPFAWPQRTHAKKPAKGYLFQDKLKPWRAVAEVLDFSDLGKSIFDRRRPLVDKTLRRILAGLKKFHTQPQVMVCNSPGCSAFLVNPQYSNNGNSIYAPAPTVIATQKSRPLSLATTTNQGAPRWEITSTDTEAMRELKTFMQENGIADIFMRMLKVKELKRIQGFPDGYVLKGPLNEQKKFIGNSVETGVVAAWLRAIAAEKPFTQTRRMAQTVAA